MQKFLIAGCAGLIGSTLSQRLLKAGHRVIGVDNFLTGSHENIARLQAYPCFDFIEQDVCHPLKIEAQLSGVYHLASPASPVDFETLPLEIMRVNAQGTWNLLDLAHEKGAKFLYTSTSEVYGNPEVHPQPETYWGHVNPIGPRSCYDESKRFAEALILNHAHVHGTRYTIARVFNTYGPGMANDGRVVPQFLLQALKGEPLTLHGNGQQTRSFCYVDDLAAGLQGLMESVVTDSQLYNLGNPQEYTIEALARIICELTGTSLQPAIIPSPRQDDPERRRPDIAKIQTAIGWKPETPLREGLKKSLDDFRSRFL